MSGLARYKFKLRKLAMRAAPSPVVKALRWRRVRRTYTPSYWEKTLTRLREQVRDLDRRPYADVQRELFDLHVNKSFEEVTDGTAIVEINNNCNIDCLMCRTSLSTRKKGRMSAEMLEETLQVLKHNGIHTATLHTIGDPLANTKLSEVFEKLRQYQIRASISTNGLLLKRHIDTLLEYMDICSLLRFSIDGATKEVYEKIRAGGSWEELLENLDLFRRELMPLGYGIRITMVVCLDNVHQIGEYISRFKEYLFCPYREFSFGFINSLSPDNAYFDQTKLLPRHIHTHVPCSAVARQTPYFLRDGRISVCCRDYDGSLVIGNVRDKQLSTVFQGTMRKELVRVHDQGTLEAHPLCATCYTVDRRVGALFGGLLPYKLYQYPDAPGAFYQQIVNQFLEVFAENGDYSDAYEALLSAAP